MSTPTRPTVLDYLLRAGDAFIEALELYGPTVTTADEARAQRLTGSVAKIVKLEHAWRRLDGRNDDGFQVAPFPG